jgi:hypothetical protein
MPSADDLFNQLVAANTKLDQIRTSLVDINATLTTGFNNLVTLGQYTNQALHHNDQQNDTIICILEHIAKNTCELLNQSALQTALQTEMESTSTAWRACSRAPIRPPRWSASVCITWRKRSRSAARRPSPSRPATMPHARRRGRSVRLPG